MSVEVIVVGGGFTGVIAAAALSKAGAKVKVFEAAVKTDPRFRGELIHPRGVRGLDQLGLKSTLFERGGVPVLGFAVTPQANVMAAVLPYGPEQGPGLGIDHHQMVLLMREEISHRRNVSITTGARITDFLREGGRIVGVKTEQGETHRAELVVVADGRQSKLRALLGMEPSTELLSYTVAFGIEGALPYGQMGHVFLGAAGPILAYPYGENRIRFCVDVPLTAAKGKQAMIELLVRDYAPVVPESLREAMIKSLREVPFEGVANHNITTQTCAAPGVALVGDAGGCNHPLTASGMTNAMNDVLTLGELVGKSGPSDAALSEYQRRRYDFVRMRDLFTDALYEVFRGQDAGSRALQEGVFRYWASSGRSREASMNILSGEEVRISRFVTEYSRVFRTSAVDVFARLVKDPRRGTRTLGSLVKTSFGRIEVAAERAARRWVDRHRMELHELPSEQR
jgi:2-polyprenyl-6-methoxyphenol hydroxylase-like FAD-dependent oxidoreductase